MKLSNKAYDALKWIALWLLPGLATLWLALGKLWGFPYITEIGGTITAVDTFLAFVLKLSKDGYAGDGTLVVNDTDPEKDLYTLEYNGNIADIAEKTSVTFMVKR